MPLVWPQGGRRAPYSDGNLPSNQLMCSLVGHYVAHGDSGEAGIDWRVAQQREHADGHDAPVQRHR